MITTILLVLALVLFILAAIGVSSNRFNLIAAGLASLTAALIFGSVALK